MRLPSAILRQTAVVETVLGEGALGPLFSDGAIVKCRIQHRRATAIAATGEVVTGAAVAFVRAQVAVTIGDRLTCDGAVYRVLERDVTYDHGRPCFYRLVLGRAD